MYVPYAQRNVPGLPVVPWNGQMLGHCPGVTVGSDGCYTTAEAQLATHWEHVVTPGLMDNYKKDRGLYVKGCQSVDGWLSKLFPDIQYEGTSSWGAAADLNSLVMSDDREIIIGLDTLNQGSKSRHFARVNDYNPRTGVLLIDDPWWGRTLNFASLYGSPARNVMKAVRYRIPGWVPPWKRVALPPVPVPPVPAPVIDPKDTIIEGLRADKALLTLQLLGVSKERDALRMAWTHLDATFTEIRSSIPK